MESGSLPGPPLPSPPLPLLEARYRPPSLSHVGTVPAFLLRDEEDLRVREEGAAAVRQRLLSLPRRCLRAFAEGPGQATPCGPSGGLAQVRQGLKKYGIDGRDKAERTALHLACANGLVDVVMYLVENKSF
ncbi:ankyrin repeat domain-containing protein 7-like [Oenanthe melanoleuca]|uniref:ankyrin repeat domain-containing protein 7-like n=1 Tax=Oenanthe melanoleuca TaxID=2939378 RepID=UPI0024C1638E|nr:ankyrin repeat domain-containing protein 7-like [Oenanthe melanoleuca]